MSKLTLALCVIWAGLMLTANAAAADAEVSIKLIAGASPYAEISGQFSGDKIRPNPRNLSFVRALAGSDKLAERVSDLTLIGASGKVPFKTLMPGEYLAEADIIGWSYRFALTPPANQNAAAHISWVSGVSGILMTADLLPEMPGAAARIGFDLPAGWKVHADVHAAGGRLNAEDLNDAVFYVGTSWREAAIPRAGRPSVLIAGEWQFTDGEAAEIIEEIFVEYGSLFNARPGHARIAIAKFPGSVQHGQWEAETRGSNITIISSDMAFRSQSLQRLHEQLRHEIFHLWIPNGLNLSGNYDWFYEGFTLYESLKTAVKFNRIRFDDYLDTLSRAHAIDNAGSRRTSLADASKNRWGGGNTQIYARGMIVAFLADIAMLQNSDRKRSIEDVFREIYSKHRSPAPRIDGHEAVIAVLKARPELMPLVDKYINGSEKIEWTAELRAAGIESIGENGRTALKAADKPRGSQKAMLDKLGYNNWRRLARKPK